MALAQVVSRVPENDHREFSADDIVVVGVAVVVRPASCHRIDVSEDIILWSLWVAGSLANFLDHVAHGVFGHGQMQPAIAVRIRSPFQFVAQKAHFLTPVGNVCFLLVEREPQIDLHPFSHCRFHLLSIFLGCIAQKNGKIIGVTCVVGHFPGEQTWLQTS